MISTDQTQTGTVIAVKNKQGHSCCGGCCDVRRAVIIVDIIMIFLLFIDIAGIMTITKQRDLLDDDEVQEAIEDSHGTWGIIMFVIEIVLLCVSIWGAVSYSTPKVVVGLGLFSIGCLMSLVQFNLPGALLTGLFAYPHYFLYHEINNGIMNPENYYNEEQSCCCV